MNKKQKKMLKRIIAATVMMIALKIASSFISFDKIPLGNFLLFALYMVPYLTIGHDILRKAWKGIRNHQVFDENFLMAVATVGAIIVALVESGDYTEAIRSEERR